MCISLAWITNPPPHLQLAWWGRLWSASPTHSQTHHWWTSTSTHPLGCAVRWTSQTIPGLGDKSTLVAGLPIIRSTSTSLDTKSLTPRLNDSWLLQPTAQVRPHQGLQLTLQRATAKQRTGRQCPNRRHSNTTTMLCERPTEPVRAHTRVRAYRSFFERVWCNGYYPGSQRESLRLPQRGSKCSETQGPQWSTGAVQHTWATLQREESSLPELGVPWRGAGQTSLRCATPNELPLRGAIRQQCGSNLEGILLEAEKLETCQNTTAYYSDICQKKKKKSVLICDTPSSKVTSCE